MSKKSKIDLKKLKVEQDDFLTEEQKAELGLAHEKKLKRVTLDAVVTKKKYSNLLKEHDALSEKFDFIQTLDLASVKSVPIEPKLSSRSSESTAVWLAGDWHAFEIVDGKTINGANEYNPTVASKSIRNFFKNALRLTEIHRAGTSIQDLLLVFLGDLMNGLLRLESFDTTAGTPQEELRFLYKEISDGIDFILKYGKFKKITIPCVVGNHSRSTQYIHIAKMVEHNNETLLYHMLAEKYSKNKKIEFIIADGYHLYQEVYGYKVRIHHGNAIRGGISNVGGVTIPINKAIMRWNMEYKADLDLIGHFHQSILGGTKFCLNGSIVGWNSFAKFIKASYEEPKQSFLLLDKKRFITSYNPIFVR